MTSLETILRDWADGGYLARDDQHRLQNHGYIRIDRYGSPQLLHKGTNTIKQLRNTP